MSSIGNIYTAPGHFLAQSLGPDLHAGLASCTLQELRSMLTGFMVEMAAGTSDGCSGLSQFYAVGREDSYWVSLSDPKDDAHKTAILVAASSWLRVQGTHRAAVGLWGWSAPLDSPFARPSLDPRRSSVLTVTAGSSDGRFSSHWGGVTGRRPDGSAKLNWAGGASTEPPMGLYGQALCAALDLPYESAADAALGDRRACPCGSELTLRSCCSPGRNEPCPCGSDAKFKKCCGR